MDLVRVSEERVFYFGNPIRDFILFFYNTNCLSYFCAWSLCNNQESAIGFEHDGFSALHSVGEMCRCWNISSEGLKYFMMYQLLQIKGFSCVLLMVDTWTHVRLDPVFVENLFIPQK